MKKKIESKEKFQWFIEPRDSHTNKVIGQMLNDLNQGAESFSLEIKDNFGVNHSVFSVPNYSFVSSFHLSKDNLSLSFNVYSRPNNNQPLRLWLFGNNKKKKPKLLKKGGKK